MRSPRSAGVSRATQPVISSGFRPEIQALRALAVGLVVIYHLWPNYLPGGYVGVDVFFAISGYLITQHLVKQVLDRGTLSLRSFYSRRIRRLLPASLLVLLVVGIATMVWAPQLLWPDAGKNIIASAFYVENWALLVNAVDYLGAGSDTIPTQHFWSLSVEEQFYLVWPVLLIGAAALSRRLGPRVSAWGTVCTVMGILASLSLVYSILATTFDQSSAYFNTGTRVWEFALGGLAALLLPRLRLGTGLAIALSWVGAISIVVSSLLLTDSSPFPGWLAAIPVLGALAIIAAGARDGMLSPAPFYRLRVVQFIGDISYSIYLWHWPLIVLLPFIIDRPLSAPVKIAVLAASVLLGWLSKRFVEDPLRSDSPHAKTPRAKTPRPNTVTDAPAAPARARRVTSVRAVFAGTAAAMLLVSGVGGAAWAISETSIDRAQTALAALPDPQTVPCFGAAYLVGGGTDCTPQNAYSDVVYPDPVIARQNTGSTGCQQTSVATDVLVCSFGSDDPAARRVALAGDSHAGQWLSAMRRIADAEGWHLDTYLRSGCGISDDAQAFVGSAARCATWNRGAISQLEAGDYDMVVVSQRSSLVGGGSKSASVVTTEAGNIARAWDRLEASGSRVIALRDTPQPVSAGIPDVPTCVSESGADASACSFPLDRGLVADPQIEASKLSPASTLVDMTRYFCAGDTCSSIEGNVLVYSDGHHMTAVYSATLTPYLRNELNAALAG